MTAKLTALALILAALLSPPASAKYTQTVRAQSSSGMSYTVTATFMTGSELNTATMTLNYDSFAVYAIIFWAQGQATVIHLDGIYMCGYSTSQSCITSHLMTPQGEDQEGREWSVCTSGYCLF